MASGRSSFGDISSDQAWTWSRAVVGDLSMTPDASLVNELHRRIGRNLLRFQEIELSLKLMLPYIHPNGGAKGADAMREYQAKSIDGKSLGLLVGQFKSAMSRTPELWESGLAALLEARNELVHHFYHRFDFAQAGSVNAALECLDNQYKQAEEWWQILRVQSLVLLLMLIETKPALAAEYGQHREKLLAQLPRWVEFVVPSAPDRTAWATTRIVKLLRLAEQHTEQVNGMTLLSRAGNFIKSSSPDLSVQAYGCKTLKEILIASGLFHVAISEGGAVSYRGNELPVDLTIEGSGALSFSAFFDGSEIRA